MMLVLAQTVPDELTKSPDYTGWYIGLGIGFAVVVVVVILVATILTLASRIGAQARAGIEKMDEARESTLAVWEIQKLNSSATAIWKAAERARMILGGTR